LNPGRRGGKPATNRLSYGAAIFSSIKGMNETKSVWREDTGESIWTYERGSSGKLKKFYKYRMLAINSLQ
jgi:hypothetical protein